MSNPKSAAMLEAIVAPYVGTDTGGERAEGFGDTTLRIRHTFTGQDGDGPAFALIGFVTRPAGTRAKATAPLL
jgi:hypothetical protein